MINTPLPISFANNKGIAKHHLIISNDIPVHKASLRTHELPTECVCVSGNNRVINYRYQLKQPLRTWNTYAKITAYGHNQGMFEFSGGIDSFDKYIALTETVKILHPLVMQLFSR